MAQRGGGSRRPQAVEVRAGVDEDNIGKGEEDESCVSQMHDPSRVIVVPYMNSSLKASVNHH